MESDYFHDSTTVAFFTSGQNADTYTSGDTCSTFNTVDPNLSTGGKTKVDRKDLNMFIQPNEVKLHLGCFKKKIHGFINIDVRDDVQPDMVDDCAKLNKFKNGSVDMILAVHIFEHFKRNEYKQVLKRWCEVLKVGGELKIAVPDLRAVCEAYLFSGDLREFQNMIYGSQKHEYDFHYIGFDEKTLTEDLKEAGFRKVERYDWRTTEFSYIDDYSQCYWPEMSYKTRRIEGEVKGKLMSLNLQAIK